MPSTNSTQAASIELSRAEQWVLHHLLLDAVSSDEELVDYSLDGDSRRPEFRVIEKLEDGYFAFTQSELESIQHNCVGHARTTNAPADRNLAAAVANRVENHLDAKIVDD